MENMKDSKHSLSSLRKLLGQLSAAGFVGKIKSFEKNYVALYYRGVFRTNIGVIAFANFINAENLAGISTERAYPKFEAIRRTIEGWDKLLSFKFGDAEYHRDYCAFGF